MIIISNYVGVLRKYAVFSGRSTLSEFWWFALADAIIYIALLAPPGWVPWGAALNLGTFPGTGLPWLLLVYTIGTFLPTLGLTVRRFHDAGHSGWMVLWGLIPTIGWLCVLVYMVKPSEMMDNKHGPYPRRAVGYGRRAASDRYFFVRK